MAKCICMFLFSIIILLLNPSIGDARQFGGSQTILKTIEGDGEVIDCVDIYKQPAFAHPLLVNHTIQLKPSFDTSTDGGKVAVEQSWHEYGQCPHGSIPIIRNQKANKQLLAQKKKTHFSASKHDAVYNADPPLVTHQYTTVGFTKTGKIHGIHARINNWSPSVSPVNSSSSNTQLWMVAGEYAVINTIEVGWAVAPYTGSNTPKIFIYWTADGYKTTGCGNLDCPGFVQVGKHLALGAKLAQISGISIYGGQQFDISYDVRKDQRTNNWWLRVNGVAIGYWPSKLFPLLSENADAVSWGGEVVVNKDATVPTQMGSGHFAEEGYSKASYIREIMYVNSDGNEVYLGADELKPGMTAPKCWTMKVAKRPDVYVFYGGPGTPGCQK